MIDVIVFRRIGPDEAGTRLQKSQPKRLKLHEVAAENGDFARLLELDEAGVVNRRHRRVAAAVDRQASGVADAAVGERGLHTELLLAARLGQYAQPGRI